MIVNLSWRIEIKLVRPTAADGRRLEGDGTRAHCKHVEIRRDFPPTQSSTFETRRARSALGDSELDKADSHLRLYACPGTAIRTQEHGARVHFGG